MIKKPVYIIAEAGVNHNGDMAMAHQMIDVAVKSGADAIKFQTFQPELLVTKYAEKALYQMASHHDQQTQFELLSALALKQQQFKTLYDYCNTKGIEFLSTPFDMQSALFLVEDLNLSKIKIGSGELTNAPLLYFLACSGVDIILSTGMATLGEIEQALGVIVYGYLGGRSPGEEAFREAYFSTEGRDILCSKVTLLHCTSNYPAQEMELNLNVLKTLKAAFPTTIGYSDHSLGVGVSLGAVALGARVIEKHFTLDKTLSGPDHAASLSVDELVLLVTEIRRLEQALGFTYKVPSKNEMDTARVARKSLMAQELINKGDVFSSNNLVAKRPGTGISPMRYWDYIGKPAQKMYESEVMLDE